MASKKKKSEDEMIAEESSRAMETGELRYAEALKELEQILKSIEQDEVDLDDLGQHVERAAHLIQVCRGKIERAEMQVKRIVDDLEQDGSEEEGGS